MSNGIVFKVVAFVKFRKKAIFWCAGVVIVYGIVLGAIAPMVIVAQAKKLTQDRLGLTLNIDRLRINPFILTLDVGALSVRQKNDTPLVSFERFFVDFEMSSLFRRAWTLNHLELTGLETHFERHSEEENTLSRLQHQWLSSAPDTDELPTESKNNSESLTAEESEMPRFLLRNIHLQVSAVSIVDHVPATIFRNTLGPMNIGVDELTSLPDRVGSHQISIKGDRGLEISWQGDIDLTPLSSQGEVSIKGPYPVIISEYLQDSLPISIVQADLATSFNYQLQSTDDHAKPITLLLTNINSALDNVAVIEKFTSEQLYKLDKFSVSNASLQWPEQTVMLPHIKLVGGEAWLQRDDSGVTNVERILATLSDNSELPANERDAARVSSSPEQASESPGWTIQNKLFELDGWAIHWLDESLDSSPKYDISNLSLALHDYQLKNHAPVTFEYGMSLLGGDIAGVGRVVPMPFGNLQTSAKIQTLMLPSLQPYVETMAKVLVEKGQFDGEVSVESIAEDFGVKSSFAVSDLKVIKSFERASSEQQDILRWKKLVFDDVQTTSKGDVVSINQILLESPFADFAIARDGTTTIDKLLIAQPADSEHSEQQKPLETKPEMQESEATALQFKIGSIRILDGAGYFADASLPLPFATQIHNLNGNITALDSQSQASADITMEGQLDEYGLLNVEGSLSPFAFEQQSDLMLRFKNVNVPNFTPYSVKFAGRKITDGRLDLDLKYLFDQGNMTGENKVVLKSFNLGDSVDQPGAMDLPLDLAIALLKDGDGKITMNVPVAGDVTNPEFSVGNVVGQALVKILTSAVTSPFRLLAGLVGSNADDFGQVTFSAGRSDISPPEKEKLDALAKAMSARPELALKISGVFDERWDTTALRLQQFDASAKTFFGEQFDSLSLASEEYVRFLESRYQQAQLLPVLSQIQLQFTKAETKNALDRLAYAKEVKSRLVAQEQVAEQTLNQLAAIRANNVKAALLAQGINTGQVSLKEPTKLSVKEGGHLVMKLDVAVAN